MTADEVIKLAAEKGKGWKLFYGQAIRDDRDLCPLEVAADGAKMSAIVRVREIRMTLELDPLVYREIMGAADHAESNLHGPLIALRQQMLTAFGLTAPPTESPE